MNFYIFKNNSNFLIERISLEQVLRDIQPRSRKTSVDNPQNHSARSNLKKTHSFENLNSSMSSNNTLMSNSERSSNGKFGMKKVNTENEINKF